MQLNELTHVALGRVRRNVSYPNIFVLVRISTAANNIFCFLIMIALHRPDKIPMRKETAGYETPHSTLEFPSTVFHQKVEFHVGPSSVACKRRAKEEAPLAPLGEHFIISSRLSHGALPVMGLRSDLYLHLLVDNHSPLTARLSIHARAALSCGRSASACAHTRISFA